MVSQQERARLVEAYKHEPVYVAAVMLKCSTCLLILVGLAVIGTGMDSTRDDAARVQQAQVHEETVVRQSSNEVRSYDSDDRLTAAAAQ
jgi:hypothetical protein